MSFLEREGRILESGGNGGRREFSVDESLEAFPPCGALVERISVEQSDCCTLLRVLEQSVTMPFVRDFFDELVGIAEAERDLALEMSRVRYIDSLGLSLLLALRTRVTRSNRRLVLVGLSGELKHTMALAGLAAAFQHCQSEADLLEFLDVKLN